MTQKERRKERQGGSTKAIKGKKKLVIAVFLNLFVLKARLRYVIQTYDRRKRFDHFVLENWLESLKTKLDVGFKEKSWGGNSD